MVEKEARGPVASQLIDPIKRTLMLSHWGLNQSLSMLVSLPDSMPWAPLHKASLCPSFPPRLPNPLLTMVSLVTAERPYIHWNSRAEGVGWISNVSFFIYAGPSLDLLLVNLCLSHEWHSRQLSLLWLPFHVFLGKYESETVS